MTITTTPPRASLGHAGRIAHAFASWRERRAQRQRRAAFIALGELEPRVLDDIGLTREDLAWGAELPLEVNAAIAVRQRHGRTVDLLPR